MLQALVNANESVFNEVRSQLLGFSRITADGVAANLDGLGLKINDSLLKLGDLMSSGHAVSPDVMAMMGGAKPTGQYVASGAVQVTFNGPVDKDSVGSVQDTIDKAFRDLLVEIRS